MVRRTSTSLLWLTGVLAFVFAATSMAHAGGSWFDPVKDTYEPGEVATLVGYTGGGAYGWIDDGPFFGKIVQSDEDGNITDGYQLDVGELTVTDTGAAGYLRLRASISFQLPTDIPTGTYFFDYCNQACDERLGDLIGGYLNVGVEPAYPISREWPLDDPEVANLAPDSFLSGPGFQVEAGKVNSGEVQIAESGRPIPTLPATTAPSTTPNTSAPNTEPAILSVAAETTDEPRPLVVASTPTTPGPSGPNGFLWGVAGIVLLGIAWARGRAARRA